MQLKFLVLSALAAFALADDDDTLPSAVNRMPSCAIPCYEQKATEEGCKSSDFNCVCSHATSLGTKLGLCLNAGCPAGDAVASLAQICVRWTRDPPATEVSAATATLASLASAASATATQGAKNVGYKRGDAGLSLVGAIAAAAILL